MKKIIFKFTTNNQNPLSSAKSEFSSIGGNRKIKSFLKVTFEAKKLLRALPADLIYKLVFYRY